MVAISLIATTFATLWWKFDVLGITDDERGAYDNGLTQFTGATALPWRLVPGSAVTKSKDIVVVGIDDDTFAAINDHEPWRQRYGSFPYDRVLWADVFSYLNQVGAKAIVFDAVMDVPKPDPTGDLALGETIKKDGIPFYLGFAMTAGVPALPKVDEPKNRYVQPPPPPPPPEPAPEPAPEEPPAPPPQKGAKKAGKKVLKKVAKAPPKKVEPPPEEQNFNFDEPSPEDQKKAAEAALVKRRQLAAEAYAFQVETLGGLEVPAPSPPPGITEDERDKLGKQYPIPAIEQVLEVTTGFGAVDHEPDPDGKMRRTRFAVTDGVNSYLLLPVAVMADVWKAERVTISPGELTIGTHHIPINPDGTAEIDYGGAFYDRFETASLADVLRYRGGTPGGEEKFKGKYVFVAGFAVGTGDIKATALENTVPAVVKHAAMLQNLLDGRFILNAPEWVSILFGFAVAFFSVALVLVIRNTFIDIGWPVLLYVGFFVVTGSFLVATKIHVLSAMPGLAGTVGSILATTWERLFARKERERMKEMFQNYMEKDLVEAMIEQKQLPSLEGQSIVITAFFSDIRGFSTFAEKYHGNPRGLMKLLNRYLSTVTPVLTKEGACIDKYIGDAVVALFGAPVSHHDHALRACRGALAAQAAITSLRQVFHDEGLPDVYTRIGLNTDLMFVGNIGSAQLMDYTALGDGMNLAARLEAANKFYGTGILMGPLTYEAVKHDVEAREIDLVRVAGKHEATAIYELMGLKGQVSQERLQVAELYGQGLLLYRQRKFQEALVRLDAALALDQADGPSKALAQKCTQYLTQPPSEGWDGVSSLEK